SRQLESETGTTEEHSLNKEARKWATRVAREHKNIIHYKRCLEECDQSWLTAHGAGQTRPGAEDRRHQRKHAQGRGLYVTFSFTA
ncbi:unnamed protein product, partial [Tetraodon nigroviridis]